VLVVVEDRMPMVFLSVSSISKHSAPYVLEVIHPGRLD